MSAVLVVDGKQAKIIHEVPDAIEVRDRSGHHLGYISSVFTSEDIAVAQARRDSDEPLRTTAEVLERLRTAAQP